MDTKQENPSRKTSYSNDQRLGRQERHLNEQRTQQYFKLSRTEFRALPADQRQLLRKAYNKIKHTSPDAAKKPSWIYVLTHPQYPTFCKVGYATKPALRLANYQTGCPYSLYKMRICEWFDDVRRPVMDFYREHDSKRLRGEWFDVYPEAAVDGIRELKRLYEQT